MAVTMDPFAAHLRVRRVLRALSRVGALAWVVFSGESPVQAEVGAGLSLDYETDTSLVGCPSASEFRAAIIRRLGRDPFRGPISRHMVVRISSGDGQRRGDARLEGRVEWRDSDDRWEGERTFLSRNESCVEMARAMELATTIQIQLLSSNEEHPAVGMLAEPAKDAPPISPLAGAAPPPSVDVAAPLPPLPEPAAPPFWVVFEVGAGALLDLGRAPPSVAPRLAVALERPSGIGARLGFTGFGFGAKVRGPEGSARLDRFVLALELVRTFRQPHPVRPSLALGIGVQEIRVDGQSAAPTVVEAHDGRVLSGMAIAGASVSYFATPRFAFFAGAQVMFFRPSLTVRIGSTEAARLEGLALLAHGGLLARF